MIMPIKRQIRKQYRQSVLWEKKTSIICNPEIRKPLFLLHFDFDFQISAIGFLHLLANRSIPQADKIYLVAVVSRVHLKL